MTTILFKNRPRLLHRNPGSRGPEPPRSLGISINWHVGRGVPCFEIRIGVRQPLRDHLIESGTSVPKLHLHHLFGRVRPRTWRFEGFLDRTIIQFQSKLWSKIAFFSVNEKRILKSWKPHTASILTNRKLGDLGVVYLIRFPTYCGICMQQLVHIAGLTVYKITKLRKNLKSISTPRDSCFRQAQS